MNFQYFDYKENILKDIINDTPEIYIFNSVKDKEFAKSFYNKTFGEKESLFLTFNEFKESIFISDKIVLREEKPALLFYNCLDKETKAKLKVNNYYDVIDTAYNFINFYKEIKEYEITEISGLEKWQSELFEIFNEIKEKYDKFLEENSYTLPYLQNDFDNYSEALFSEYNKINFINIFSLTPFDKKILKKLETNFELNFALQITKGDFDEEKLEIDKITLIPEIDVQVFETKDAVMQLFNLIPKLEENSVILDQNIKNSNYDKLISANKIKLDKKITLEETAIFEFLSLWYDLLRSVEFINKEFVIQNKTLLNCLNNKSFQKYYCLSKAEYEYFFLFIEDDYKYVSVELLGNDNVPFMNRELNEKFIHIINDIKNLYDIKTIQEYTHFIENDFKFSLLDDNNNGKTIFDNNIAKFFEALSEVQSIEDMNIIKDANWGKYFSKNKISENILKLILKYLREKQIKTVEESVYTHFITNPDNYEIRNCDKLIYININSETLPVKPPVEFLLTDKQREKLGLPSHDQSKLYEKYKFFRNIFSSTETTIFSIKNEEKNIDRSSFIEELLIHYNLKIEESGYLENDISPLIESVFNSDNSVGFGTDLKYVSDPKLIFSQHDYKEKTLNIGSYDYNLMMKCYYKFFMDKVAKLSCKSQEISYKIDPKLLGLIIHSIFDKLSKIKEQSVKSGKFDTTIDEIQELLNTELSILKYKLPVNFNKYYEEILFPIFINNAKLFYDTLSSIVNNDVINNFSSEKGSMAKKFLSDKIDINLTGRLDLLIETPDKKYIIDYKTGHGDPGQLDFYSVLLYDDAQAAEKLIYNAWDGKFITDDRSEDKILSKDILQATLLEFINEGYYKRAEKKSACVKCEYINICRQRWEDNE